MPRQKSFGIPYFIALVIPVTLAVLKWFGESINAYFPSWLLIPASFAVVVVSVVVYTRHSEKEAGLKPAKKGYSAKLDLFSQKLRKHADAIEEAIRFGTDLPFLPLEFEWSLKDLLTTAKRQSQVDLAPYLLEAVQKEDSLIDEALDVQDAEEESGSTDPSRTKVEEKITRNAELLRQGAAELEQFAIQVRGSGGLFHQSGMKISGCIFYLLLYTAAGIYTIHYYWQEKNWAFWLGWCVVVSDIFFAIVLYRMQTEPA